MRRQAKGPPQAGRVRIIGIANLVFLLVGIALVPLFGLLKAALATRRPLPSSVTTRAAAEAPWGALEYSRFALRQPDEYLPDSTNQFPQPAWYFEKATPVQIAELFNSLDTPGDVRQLLLDRSRWETNHEAVVFYPTPEILLGLGQRARERIYSILGRSPVNFPQHHPFRFRADGFDQWFAHTRLAPEKLQLVRSLTYTNQGGAMCLADIDVLREKLGSEGLRDLFESLYSEQSLFLSLHVKTNADLVALAGYWGRGGREQEVLAILKSVADLPGGGSINVAYLLPPFARLRLYTFAPATSEREDCFWTAVNFFKKESDLQTNYAASLEALRREYRETQEPPRLGDVVLLLENSRAVHACVYIADDVVFTKNGVNYRQPWVLMAMKDLLPCYASDQFMSVVVFRPKHL